MSSIFNQLLNVKGTVVEDVRIVDSPLRPEPVLEVRVRPRAGALRCSRCGRRRRGYDQVFCFNVCSTGSAVFFRSVG